MKGPSQADGRALADSGQVNRSELQLYDTYHKIQRYYDNLELRNSHKYWRKPGAGESVNNIRANKMILGWRPHKRSACVKSSRNRAPGTRHFTHAVVNPGQLGLRVLSGPDNLCKCWPDKWQRPSGGPLCDPCGSHVTKLVYMTVSLLQ
jgi:hypothetical protein